MARPDYRIVVEASFSDKVRALRGLVDLYRRRMPERMDRIAGTAPSRHRQATGAPESSPR